MSGEMDGQSHDSVMKRVLPIIEHLARAFEYSMYTSSDIWEFAVEHQELRERGFSTSDFRVLVRMDLVEHASEITLPGQDGRHFQATGELTFATRTCFVLSGKGVKLYSESRGRRRVDGDSGLSKARPSWNASSRVLRFNQQVVKRFRVAAANQEAVLCAFEFESDRGNSLADPGCLESIRGPVACMWTH